MKSSSLSCPESSFTKLSFAGLLTALLIMPALLWSQGTGTITGRVSNQSTSVNLEGATVRIEGSSVSTTTARDGSFRLPVFPGTYRLVASYTGLDPEARQVIVEAGRTVSVDFGLTAEIYQMSELVVAGEREGTALAVTLQRQAPNVKNVVAVDAYGSVAGNPAELLQRVPGVVPELVGGDIRFISIRGIDKELNSVQIDGNRIASISNDRSFQFQNIGSDHIESMEVVKAPTPDMDADAIGGSVNLRSRSAFDLTARRITFSVGSIRQNNSRDDFHPAGSFSYSDVLDVFGGQRNLGISFSGGYRQHNGLTDRAWQDWQNTGSNPGPAFLYRLRVQDYANVRTRYGAGLKLDYRLSDDAKAFVNLTYAPHRENNAAPQAQFTGNQTIAPLNNQGQPTGNGSIMPGFTETQTQIRPVAGSSVVLIGAHLKRKATAYTGQVGGSIDRGVWSADYDASYSYAQNNPWTINTSMRLTNVGWIFDTAQGKSRWAPAITFNGGPDPFNVDNYTGDPLGLSSGRTLNEIYGAQANYRRNFDLAVPAYIKAGVKFREEIIERWRSDRRWTYLGPDGVANSGDETMRPFVNTPYRERGHRVFGFYPLFDYLHARPLLAHAESTPNQWREDLAYAAMRELVVRQSLTEDVAAGYLMGNTQIGRVSLLGGLRVEQTKVKGTGPVNQVTPEEAARRAAWTGPVTQEEEVRRVRAQYGTRRTASREYRSVFPGFHMKYEPVNGVILRGSYSTSIGRPSYNDIIPNDNVNYDSQIVNVSNPGLKPQYSDNFDVSIEYYFEPVGLFSAGAFLKEIDDFIYNTAGSVIPAGPDNGFQGDYAGFELRSKANGGFARVRGFEVNYQQQFTFLPGWWRGFGTFASYTWLESQGDYGSIGTVRTTEQLTGFTPRAFNAGVSFIHGRMNFRANYGHKGNTLLSFNANESRRRWLVPANRVDIKLRYAALRNLDVYLDLYNAFNDTVREEWGFQRPSQLFYRNDPEIHFGIAGRF